MAFDGDEREQIGALDVPVVETIGAGDALAAGSLAGCSPVCRSAGASRAQRVVTRALTSTRDHID